MELLTEAAAMIARVELRAPRAQSSQVTGSHTSVGCPAHALEGYSFSNGQMKIGKVVEMLAWRRRHFMMGASTRQIMASSLWIAMVSWLQRYWAMVTHLKMSCVIPGPGCHLAMVD